MGAIWAAYPLTFIRIAGFMVLSFGGSVVVIVLIPKNKKVSSRTLSEGTPEGTPRGPRGPPRGAPDFRI